MRYGTIVVDPPWPMPTGGTRGGTQIWNESVPSRLPYSTMALGEIASLPVDDLACQEAHLYVWTTNAFLEETYGLVRGWNFRVSQVLVWAKAPRGIGMGGAFTNTTEFVMFAWRGRLAPKKKLDTSWFQWKRGEHSAKPEAFLDIVETVSPGPYLELFARRARFGWDYWGDQSLETVDDTGWLVGNEEDLAAANAEIDEVIARGEL